MDNNIWFYIIAAVIYFLTRAKRKKKKQQTSRPTEANRPQQKRKPVSFEDLLKEITEGREEEKAEVVEEREPEPIYEEIQEEKKEEKKSIRHFADDESRKVYEESIKRAESTNTNIKFARDSKYVMIDDDDGQSIADEIREGLQDPDSARKAIIYSEILNKKY